IVNVGKLEIMPHFTPGHTPGGTTWTWKSCEGEKCAFMDYADSLTAVSLDGFKFSANHKLLAGFDKSFTFLQTTPCDILLTPHPEVSDLWKRLEAHQFIEPSACKDLATRSRAQLKERLASEAAK